MRKLSLILLATILITGCGNSGKNNSEALNKNISENKISSTINNEKASSVVQPEIKDNESKTVETENNTGKEEVLPEYKYTGSDKIIRTICEYMNKKDGFYSKDGEVLIPCPAIFDVDDKNEEDIKVYGNFWILGYIKDGNNLLSESGGEMPGRFHLKKNGDEYEVVSFDEVGDGSYYAKDIKKICADTDGRIPSDYLYKIYMEHTGFHEKVLSYIRKAFIERYVEDNRLDVVSFQDKGHDKIMIEPVKKASYKGRLYKDTGEIFYFMTCGTMDFSIKDVNKEGELSLSKDQTNFTACDGQIGIGENKIGLYYEDKLHIFEAD